MRNIKEINKVVSKKDKMVSIFKETLEICHNERYENLRGEEVDISTEIIHAMEGTELFEPEYVDDLIWTEVLDLSRTNGKMVIEVTRESTVECGIRLWGEMDHNIKIDNGIRIEPLYPLALNFASGVSVGGGVLGGAVAQEEDLCRSSALFDCLNQGYVEKYYEENRKTKLPVYTNYMIYSCNVPFFRDGGLKLLDSPFLMSILTSPAVYVREMDMDGDFGKYINGIFYRRIEKMLKLVAALGHREIILGAWGCGAFGNSAVDVADMFKRILLSDNFRGLFDRVVFAVYAKEENDLNYLAFLEAFNGT